MPLALSALISSGAVPVDVTVTVCCEFPPIGTLPNSSVVLLTCMAGLPDAGGGVLCCCCPVPETAIADFCPPLWITTCEL